MTPAGIVLLVAGGEGGLGVGFISRGGQYAPGKEAEGQKENCGAADICMLHGGILSRGSVLLHHNTKGENCQMFFDGRSVGCFRRIRTQRMLNAIKINFFNFKINFFNQSY